MPHRQLKTRTDCEDFVRGCTIMGIGGGGKPEAGLCPHRVRASGRGAQRPVQLAAESCSGVVRHRHPAVPT